MLSLLDGVRWCGTPIVGERLRSLICALASHAPDGVSDDWLIEHLWGAQPPANPTKALQVVVSRARAATSPGLVTRTSAGYRLGLAAGDVDILRAGELVRSARARLDAGELAAARVHAEEAIELTDANSAADWPFEQLRTRADGYRAEARVLLGFALSRLGEHGAALPLLEAAAAERPGEQDVLVCLLRSEAAVRGPGSAVERYEHYRADLADRLGVDPSPALRRLHAELLAADRPVRAGLRFDPTALVGRDDDVRSVREFVATTRVTSIVGAGGLGKTRLAHVLGRDAEQSIVHFVELVGVGAGQDVVGEIGSALGVRDSLAEQRTLTPVQRADIRSRIAAQLDRTPSLLILDNCEHVIDAVAELVAFLVATTRDLRVLTTSRAPLNIAAERVYPLGQLGSADSAALFRARALAVRPGAILDDAAVGDVVSRLDGLPLAIELAAAKVRVMSVEDIARRLANRFALLRGGDRSAADRHQTLLGVIDWSWNLLTEAQRDALRRLSVFQDGFTLSTAESVLGDSALESVQGLADQSLLEVRDAALTEGSVRFGMLETIREFGWMQLLDAGMDVEALRARRRWARAYAGELSLGLFGHDLLAAMNALRAEETNLTEVLRAAVAEPDPETVVVLLAALAGYWSIRGEHLRIVLLADSVEHAVRDWTPPPELADQARLGFATLVSNVAMISDVDPTAVRESMRALGPHSAWPLINALTTVTLAAEPGDPAGNTERLVRLCADPDPHIARLALQQHAHNLENSGDPAAAVEAAGKALALASSADVPWWFVGAQHTQLAQLHAQLGYLDEAAEHAELALPAVRQLDATDDMIQLRGILALEATARGQFELAQRTIAENAGEQRRRTQYGGGSVVVVTGEAELKFARGELADGLRDYRLAVEQLRRVRIPGFPEPSGFEPWTVYVEAVALTAHAIHCGAVDGGAAEGDELFAALRGKLPTLLTADRDHIDFPVAGTGLFGLGVWGLVREALPAGEAIRLVALADRFAYARTAPTMAMRNAAEVADQAAPGLLDRISAEYGDRRGPQLLEETLRVLEQLPGISEPAAEAGHRQRGEDRDHG